MKAVMQSLSNIVIPAICSNHLYIYAKLKLMLHAFATCSSALYTSTLCIRHAFLTILFKELVSAGLTELSVN